MKIKKKESFIGWGGGGGGWSGSGSGGQDGCE